MSRCAIGDPHLHFQSALKTAHPQLKDKARKSHAEKLQKNCVKPLTADDTLAPAGTKGFVFEGPFHLGRRGRVIGRDKKSVVQYARLVRGDFLKWKPVKLLDEGGNP